MPNTPTTSVILFAAFWAKFPNMDAKTYIEIPAAKSIQSLEGLSKWLKKLDMSEIAAPQAFISIEISNDRLPLNVRGLVDECRHDCREGLVYFLQESIIALVETLVVHPSAMVTTPADSDEIEIIELQILDIEKQADTTPGIVVETSEGCDIASDREWWKSRDLPGSVIGHLSIEISSHMLAPETREFLTEMDLGNPENMEGFIQAQTLAIAKKLFTA